MCFFYGEKKTIIVKIRVLTANGPSDTYFATPIHTTYKYTKTGIHACIYTHIYAYTHKRADVFLLSSCGLAQIYIHKRADVYMRPSTDIHACKHTYIHIHMNEQMSSCGLANNLCIHACIYTYICIYT